MMVSPSQSSSTPSPPPLQPPPSSDVLLERISELEANHAFLKSEISKFIDTHNSGVPKHADELQAHGHRPQCSSLSGTRPQSPQNRTSFAGIRIPFLQNRGVSGARGSSSWIRSSGSTQESSSMSGFHPSRTHAHGSGPQFGPFPEQLTERHYVNILQSMGQAIYIFNLSAEVIYWNRTAEILYGYTEEEALGSNVLDLVVHRKHHDMGSKIVSHLISGNHWSGQFPLVKKSGELFNAIITNTPLYDDNGVLVGVIGVTNDSRPFSSPTAIGGTHLPVPDEIQDAGPIIIKSVPTP
eukprot:c18948_g3_i2 orf=330-1217(+)